MRPTRLNGLRFRWVGLAAALLAAGCSQRGGDDAATGSQLRNGNAEDAGTVVEADAAVPAPPAPPAEEPIVVTCPAQADGGAAPPGTSIAVLPTQALHRCTEATKDCWVQAPTDQAMAACLQSDTNAPFVAGATSVNCAKCSQIQSTYCSVASCKAEYSSYICCKQTGAACQAETQQVVNCLNGAGGAAAEQCMARTVPRCF